MTKPVQENYQFAREKVAAGKWTIDAELGVVIGEKGKAIRRRNSWGYIQIKFRDPSDYRKTRAVLAHRVIWEAVNGPLSEDLTVNHINGDKTDNRIVNLEAVTLGENVRHAYRTGLHPVGEDAPNAKLTPTQVRDIYRRSWAGERHRDIAALYGTDNGTVSKIRNGLAWRTVTLHKVA